MNTRKIEAGFTLLELLMAASIVIVVASLAYPSYVKYVQDAQRSNAQQIMLRAAAELERYYSRNGAYITKDNYLKTIEAFNEEKKGYIFEYVPNAVDVNGVTRLKEFTLYARPTVGSNQQSDRCGDLSIDEKSNKKPNASSGNEYADCW